MFSCLFVDVGGVLLTNGWDHRARRRAVSQFKLEWNEFESRHGLFVEPYELGLIGLEEYLNGVVFYQKRDFSRSSFRNFIFAQSKSHLKMMELIVQLKAIHGLKIVVVSNEGREVNAYRIRKFKLAGLVDFFISSCFVHLRKPDVNIYKMALDTAQISPEKIVYIENTPLFDKVAEGLGIKSIFHKNYQSTRACLSSWGLSVNEGIEYE